MGGPATVVNPAASVPSGAVGQAAAAAANQPAPAPLIQAYDPTNQTPYQAPVLPGVDQASPTAADALGPNQNIQDFGAASPAAGAAAIGNQLLRGVMQGVAVGKVDQAIRLHRTSQALQGNLDSASQDVYNLAKQGVDPNDPQMQAAQDRKNVAWKSMMDFYGQHVPGVQIDPNTGQPKPNKVSILDRLRGNDPAQVPAALYEGMLKAGPPVDHQIAQFQTPQYKQYLAQQGAGVAATQAAGIAQQQSLQGEADLQKKVYDLAALPTRTPAQEQELDTARIALSKFGMGSRDKKVSTYVGTDGLQHDVMQTPFGTTYDIPSGTGVRLPGAPVKVGSFGDFMTAAYGSQPTAKDYIAGRKLWGQAAASSTTGTHEITVPQPDGSLKLIQVGTTSQKTYPGTPSAASLPTTRMAPAAGAPTTVPTPGATTTPTMPAGRLGAPVAPPSAASAAAPSPSVAPPAIVPPQAAGVGATATQAAAAPPPATAPPSTAAAATATTASGGNPKPGDIVGGRQTAEEVAARKTLDTARNALITGQLNLQNPTPVGDAGMLTSWLKGHVNRVTQTEIKTFNNLGGAQMQLQGGIAHLVSGKMTDQQRQWFMQAIRDQYTAAQGVVSNYSKPGGISTTAPPPPPQTDYKKKYGFDFTPAAAASQ